MRKKIIYLFIVLGALPFFLGAHCHKTGKDGIDIGATSTQVLADGTALDTIYAGLPVNTPASNRMVFFQTGAGDFANGFDTMTVLANRTDIDPGYIAAVVTWHASLRSGPDTITAYTTTEEVMSASLTLTLDSVAPDSLWLTASSDSITNAFNSQTTITGILFNNFGGMVSINTLIFFSDSLVSPTGTTAAGGTFQPVVAKSDTASTVKTIYSLPSLTASGLIKITGYLQSPSGSKTPLPGKVEVYYSYSQ